jgi:hypothetical protein
LAPKLTTISPASFVTKICRAFTVSNTPSFSPVAAIVTTAHIAYHRHRQRHRQALVGALYPLILLLDLFQSLFNSHWPSLYHGVNVKSPRL